MGGGARYNQGKGVRKAPALRVTCSLVRLQDNWGSLLFGLEQALRVEGREIPESGPTLLRSGLSNDCRRTVVAGVFYFWYCSVLSINLIRLTGALIR